MNLLKAKKTIEQQDVNEFKLKKEKYLERKKLQKELHDAPAETESVPPEEPTAANISPEILNGIDASDARIRNAEYIGSFSIVGTNQQCRIEQAKRLLETMQNVIQKKPVILIMTAAGIKVCDKRGQVLCMAHALRRISHVMYDDVSKRVAFLAREPKGHILIQYCHVFIHKDTEKTQEIYNILCDIFKTEERKSSQEKAKALGVAFEEQLEEQRRLFMEVQRRAEQELRKSEAQKNAATNLGVALARQEELTGSKAAHSNTSNGAPATRGDTHDVADALHTVLKEAWFKPQLSRSQANQLLRSEEVGAFVIRSSSIHKGSFVLSVVVPRCIRASGILHYLIEAGRSGTYKLKGLDMAWPSLQSLVAHHALMTDLLPCTLLTTSTTSGPDEGADGPLPRWRGRIVDTVNLDKPSSVSPIEPLET